ncbi:188dcaef-3bc2-413c-a467-a8a255d564fa [Thermothielavioides terrestris]|uniref:188dcaef-3bc2-413c-a467-a8a255d564fa n=1 Tax=Thermothielavioides terrestris TaxID=2587410 RepID=A0A3S5CX99_9PEZI|nr:188dcaef-3bc2-413c-a467-a8a255d564fa [Thermothielavioides terrestris]
MLPYNLTRTAIRLLLRRDDSDSDDDGNGTQDCVYATPGPNGNVPVTACNSYYNYDPQFAPAVAVAVLFGIFTAIHVVEAFLFKKRYAWVLIMGALWETIAFVIHSLGTKDQQQIGYATTWNILFLLAPLWINAFAYMTFARMVLFWHPEGKVAGFRAAVIARWFVLADILSFVVQAVGGIMASPGASANIIQIGLNIFMGGMGLQLLFILVRIIFRMAEFARGITPDNPVPFHEAYSYALDCFPMMVALLLLAIYHPGRYLVGPDSEFPRLSRKEKKALKCEKKAARREEKEAKSRAKKSGGARTSSSEGMYQLEEV